MPSERNDTAIGFVVFVGVFIFSLITGIGLLSAIVWMIVIGALCSIFA